MVYSETIKDETIRQGESAIEFTCDGCHGTKRRLFNYVLKHQIIVHHGQCVEGDQEELLKLETTLPVQIQCGNCRSVYAIEQSPAIYGNYSNPNGLSLFSTLTAEQNFGSRENIDGDLEKALKSISRRFIGIPAVI